MNDMRRLMEAVEPLFEATAQDYARELLSQYDGDDQKQALQMLSQIFQDADAGRYAMNDDDLVSDVITMWGRMKRGVAETTSAAGIAEGYSDAEYELDDIMKELEDLSDRASAIAREHYPDLYHTYDAYGAFDFGTSRNSRDLTFASFVKEALEGDVEDEDY